MVQNPMPIMHMPPDIGAPNRKPVQHCEEESEQSTEQDMLHGPCPPGAQVWPQAGKVVAFLFVVFRGCHYRVCH